LELIHLGLATFSKIQGLAIRQGDEVVTAVANTNIFNLQSAHAHLWKRINSVLGSCDCPEHQPAPAPPSQVN
jgi:hypothetical protein